MELEPPVFQILLQPEEVPVIRDVAREHIAISIGTGNPPHEWDLDILNGLPDVAVVPQSPSFSNKKGIIKFENLSIVPKFVDRLNDYAEDVDRAVTNIKMTLPPEIAAPLIDERLSNARVATRIATTVIDLYEFHSLIGSALELPDNWSL